MESCLGHGKSWKMEIVVQKQSIVVTNKKTDARLNLLTYRRIIRSELWVKNVFIS